jgi:predicted nuclease of predicted toxin-antitoxin system
LTLKFYTDVHISREAVKQLRSKGVDIIHCAEVGMDNAKDPEHWEYVIENERIMVTCDRGFTDRHFQELAEGRDHAGVVYFRMEDECQSISIVVRTILQIHEAADDPKDMYNQLWRTSSCVPLFQLTISSVNQTQITTG